MVQRRTLVTVLGSATVAAAALAFVPHNEGRSNTPYADTGGTWTVCDGQTGVPMHYYTNAQCDAMLSVTLTSIAAQIEANTPDYAALPDGVKVATLDFTYNVGVNAYKDSMYHTMLLEKKLPAACDQLLRWRFVAGKDCSVRANNCYGVWQRRQAEKEMCTSGKLS